MDQSGVRGKVGVTLDYCGDEMAELLIYDLIYVLILISRWWLEDLK